MIIDNPRRSKVAISFAACAATLLLAVFAIHRHVDAATAGPKNVDWSVYGGSKAGERYSPLAQINRDNVKQLKLAWTYDTGETAGLQTHPLIVNGTLFGYTPGQIVFALNAATGKELWRFNSGIKTGQPDRGLAFWTSPDGKDKRLFAQTLNFVWALDPATGKPIESFGSSNGTPGSSGNPGSIDSARGSSNGTAGSGNRTPGSSNGTPGRIDLRDGLGPESPAGTVAITTPGTVYKDLIILGFRTGEASPSPHGDIRAYNVRTGQLVWSFHTIPHPGEPGYETWPKDAWKYTGGANNWTGSVLDEQRGILYTPTGSAVTDFYGADRLGNDLYANSLLAIDAATGKLLWHFQAVHHDMWDRDFPAPPVLVTVHQNGKAIDAVAQVTKHGLVFVFDRVTGTPLFPIEERPFPASTTPGEAASPTQPMPTLPEPYARQRLTAGMLTERTPEAHAWAAKEFATFISNGQFVPLTVGRQTVVFPGFDGGAEWGGEAVDPRSATLYINANDVAWTGGLRPVTAGGTGATAYGTQCAACHAPDRKGQPPVFPSLIEATSHLSQDEMAAVVHDGRGRMPSFPNLTGDTLAALLTYVRTGAEPADTPRTAAPSRSDKEEVTAGTGSNAAPTAKYQFTGYRKFLDPDGYPAIAPPWGTLNAIDLNTGKYLWKIPFGEYPELAANGTKPTGTENYGGPVVTAGGLLFIGATNFDNKMHAYDAKSGKLLWDYTMDFAGNATPATYMVNGKQYVVIATSSTHNPKAKQGAKYIAFALP